MIPRPAYAVAGTGALDLGPATRITVDPSADPRVEQDAERWAALVRAVAGIPLEVAPGGPAPNAIHIAASADGESLGEEGYRLEVSAESATITAAAPAGAYYALQTLRQLLPTALENVLLEVMDLFPGTYIHIGGDEAPKERWEESPLAQEVIRREGLADEAELQSWFIRRIEGLLAEHGRRLIGWDEILGGGLPPRATVMSWRGIDGGIEAAREGHDVIMTPNSHLYFDYYQADPDDEPLAIGGFLPLDTVYAYEPIPEALNADEASHVLGAQGNVWTEYLKTPEYVQYMVFPRLLALSEVVWSPRDRRDWASFQARLPASLARLDALGVNYRSPF